MRRRSQCRARAAAGIMCDDERVAPTHVRGGHTRLLLAASSVRCASFYFFDTFLPDDFFACWGLLLARNEGGWQPLHEGNAAPVESGGA